MKRITDPSRRWISSTTHSDPSAFAKRQKARMREAAEERERLAAQSKEAASVVTPITAARKP